MSRARRPLWPAGPVAVVVSQLLLVAPSIAFAQPGATAPSPPARPASASAHHREGFYFGVHIGGGMANVILREEGRGQIGKDRTSALAFGATAGGTIGRTVLGGTALMIGTGAMEDAAGQTDHGLAMIIGPSVDWFSSATGGFNIGGMLGVGVGDVPFTDPATDARAVGGGLWAGYARWVGDEWSIGARLQLVGATATTTNLKTVIGAENERSARFATWALMATAIYH